MPYNSLIDRTDADALVPEDVSRDIIQGAIAQSAVLSLGRRLQNMPRGQTRMPVLSALPIAYFVTGDSGLKQTTEQAWANKYLNAEEIAAIVPIPQAVLDDADYDIWGEVRPRLMEAFGAVIDAAVFWGTNKPAAWPTDILTAATAAGNSVDLSSGEAAGKDLYDLILGEDGVFAKVEADGFGVTGCAAHLSFKAKLRGLREKVWNGTALVPSGQPLFMRSMQERTRYELDGAPLVFPENGAFDATKALMVAGEFRQLVYSFRQDITYTIADQAVITDNTNAVVYNLFQQDMVALRAVMRLAWQVPNPINRLQPNESNRYPFAVLVP